MSQELELEAIREARRKKFTEMGVVPTFTQEEIVQASANVGGNSATRDRINKIKNGMMRDTMLHLNEAKNPNEFQPIPEVPLKNSQQRNGQQRNESTKKIDFGSAPAVKPVPSEFSNVDSLFDTDGRGSYSNHDVVMGHAWEERKQREEQRMFVAENIDTGRNWEDEFRGKKQVWQEQEQRGMQKHTPTQYNDQQNYPMTGPTQIRNLVEEIANEIVVQKVKQAIFEIKKQEDNQLTYKRVRNKQGQLLNDHISIGDKIFKIQEVKRK